MLLLNGQIAGGQAGILQKFKELTPEQQNARREPVHIVAAAFLEMMNPSHPNNAFRTYAFDYQMQKKLYEDARQHGQEKTWHDDTDILHKQSVFPTFKMEDSQHIYLQHPNSNNHGSQQVQCPVERPMLYKAMKSDPISTVKMPDLQKKYANEQKIKDQVFHYPTQINSIGQLLHRLEASQARYQDQIVPKIEKLKTEKIPQLKTDLEKQWFERFQRLLQKQRQSISLFIKLNLQLPAFYQLDYETQASSIDQPRLLSQQNETQFQNILQKNLARIASMNEGTSENLEKIQTEIANRKLKQTEHKQSKLDMAEIDVDEFGKTLDELWYAI